MAKCEICNREMLTSKGCAISEISISGKKYKRIKVGDKFDFNEGVEDPDFKCHDCGATTGHYHHWGCDAERCPKCYEQLIGCECEDVFVEESEEN